MKESKLVIVVRLYYPDKDNQKRKIRTGKLMSQAAHAGSAWLCDLIKDMINEDKEEENKTKDDQLKVWPQATMGGGPSFSSISEYDTPHPAPGSLDPSARLASSHKEGDIKQGAYELGLLRSKIESMQKKIEELTQKQVSKEEKNMNSARLRARAKARRAYWLGGGGVNEPTPGKPKYEKEESDKIRNKEDKQMNVVETGSEGLYPGDEEKLRDAGRNGFNVSKASLEERAMKRRAYFLGGGGINEPTPGKVKYPKEDADKIRDTQDKHLETKDLGGTDGMVPGDKEIKEKLLRAKLTAKFVKVADEAGVKKEDSRWEVYAGDKMVLAATGKEIYEDEIEQNWDYLASKDYGRDLIKYIRSEGLDRVAYMLKGAAPGDDAVNPMAMPTADTTPVAKPVVEQSQVDAPVVTEQPADKKPVKNDDLWRELDTLAQQHQIEWLWVKGHAGDLGNERADQLANQGVAQVMHG
jgi:hypothetical protein